MLDQKENLKISNPDTPEERLNEYVDSILESVNDILEAINRNPDAPAKYISQKLAGLQNMIINDSHYVFKPEIFPVQDNNVVDANFTELSKPSI